jgi:hypothetical protein
MTERFEAGRVVSQRSTPDGGLSPTSNRTLFCRAESVIGTLNARSIVESGWSARKPSQARCAQLSARLTKGPERVAVERARSQTRSP